MERGNKNPNWKGGIFVNKNRKEYNKAYYQRKKKEKGK